MYHISDIKRFIHCNRLYFLSKDVQSEFKQYLRNDESLNDLLIQYFKIDNYYLGQRNDQGDRFFKEKDNYEWFIRPRFVDKELRINIPVVHKVNDEYDLYFIYSNTQLKELDTLTYTTAFNLLNKIGVVVNEIYIIYINGNYVLENELEVDKLFVCTNKYKNKKIVNIIKNDSFGYEDVIDKMNSLTLQDCPACKNKYCKQYGICDYYLECFEEIEDIEDDCILSLVSSKYKNEMYDEGLIHLKDVDLGRLEGNRTQYAQIMASNNNGLFVDKLALKDWIVQLNERPISFIDFEWDRYLVPPYSKMKPMDVVCFEFALYTLNENGHLEHKTFVGTGDCRKEFIINLLKSLPSTGPIVAYNALGAECLRIEELANIFPEYSDELHAINARFVDLATPFVEGLVYDIRMSGNYTLKKLVDICSSYSYKSLDIYDGMEAVYNWRNVDKGDSIDGDKIIDNLKQYCSLDAYGLFLVYKWLIEILVNH